MPQSKAEMLRNNIDEIKEMRFEQKFPLRHIARRMEEKLGIEIGVGSIWSLLQDTGLKVLGKEIVLNISPEKLDLLKQNGTIRLTHEGVNYLIEGKKYCCKKLQKYARYRGKLVMKFKICPFCGDKK